MVHWLFVVACELLSSCSTVACEISVPRPGVEPTSPALESGFLTTGSPGKSLGFISNLWLLIFWITDPY